LFRALENNKEIIAMSMLEFNNFAESDFPLDRLAYSLFLIMVHPLVLFVITCFTKLTYQLDSACRAAFR